MQGGKGIVSAFVAGLAVAGGAVLLLRDEALLPRAPETACIAELDGQIQRLEQTVSRLSSLGAAAAPRGTAPADPGVQPTPLSAAEIAAEATWAKAAEQALAAANSMVEQALQSGQWTRAQQAEFSMVAMDLNGDEHSRLMARIAAAINRDELKIELP